MKFLVSWGSSTTRDEEEGSLLKVTLSRVTLFLCHYVFFFFQKKNMINLCCANLYSVRAALPSGNLKAQPSLLVVCYNDID